MCGNVFPHHNTYGVAVQFFFFSCPGGCSPYSKELIWSTPFILVANRMPAIVIRWLVTKVVAIAAGVSSQSHWTLNSQSWECWTWCLSRCSFMCIRVRLTTNDLLWCFSLSWMMTLFVLDKVSLKKLAKAVYAGCINLTIMKKTRLPKITRGKIYTELIVTTGRPQQFSLMICCDFRPCGEVWLSLSLFRYMCSL